MPIDASIALGVKPFQVESPVNQLTNILQLKKLQGDQQVNELALADDKAAREAYALSGGDNKLYAQELQKRGLAKQGMALQEFMQKSKKADADLLHVGAQTAKDQQTADTGKADALYKAADHHAQDLPYIQTPQDIVSWIQRGKSKGLWDDARAQQMLEQADKIPDVATFVKMAGAAAVPELERFKDAAMTARSNAEIAGREKTTKMTNDTSLTTNALTNKTSRENNSATIAGQAEQGRLNRGQADTHFNINQEKKAAPKPLPPGALKMQQEAIDAIGVASSINADLSAVEQQIADKKLKFGPVSNLVNKGMNAIGMSSEESRNFGSFNSTLERLRNESLRLNAGVQTDGDAQRAWNELFQNISDTGLVQQRLKEIKNINKRGTELQQLKLDQVRANYGYEPLDTSAQRNVPPALNTPNPGAPKPIKSDADYNALPSGTEFIGPDGKTRRKP